MQSFFSPELVSDQLKQFFFHEKIIQMHSKHPSNSLVTLGKVRWYNGSYELRTHETSKLWPVGPVAATHRDDHASYTFSWQVCNESHTKPHPPPFPRLPSDVALLLQALSTGFHAATADSKRACAEKASKLTSVLLRTNTPSMLSRQLCSREHAHMGTCSTRPIPVRSYDSVLRLSAERFSALAVKGCEWLYLPRGDDDGIVDRCLASHNSLFISLLHEEFCLCYWKP